MKQFAMTFNKPAITAFFGQNADAVRLKIDGDQIKIKPVKGTTTGRNVYQLKQRSRGGAEIVLRGEMAHKLAMEMSADAGTMIRLEPGDRHWVDGQPVAEKPSKVIPTARIWLLK